MYVTNIFDLNTTNDYDNITDYDIITNYFTINENNIDMIIPSLLLTIPCGLSILYLMIYTLIKPLETNKG